MTTGQKILFAFLAALLGLAVGAATTSLIGTIELLFLPGLEYGSATDVLLGLPMTFLEGLFWALLGGVLYVLPFGFLLLIWYALTFNPERLQAGRVRWFALGFTALLYPPLFIGGARSTLLLAIAIALGAWVSLTFLNRRLSS